MNDPIYLDHNATTATRPEVVEAMRQCYHAITANPASQHRAGQQARRALEDARERIAQILDADLAAPRRDRVIFTSGGTEANNLALLGIARALGPNGRIIIAAAEHQSVIEPAEYLLEQGWRLDTVGLTEQGTVRLDQLRRLLEPPQEHTRPTPLVSVQAGNHETGVVQPVAEMAEICRQSGAILHTDAVQVVGKRPVSFRRLGVAALSLAAHKFQGPLGIGALLVRNDTPIAPLMFGGHQQSSLRPGTEPVALVVGMATALDLWQKEHESHDRHVRTMRDRFEAGLRTKMPDIVVHGAAAERLPQTSSVAFPGIDGQVLLMALDLAGVACSVGSACSSGSTELSPTLRAMGLSNAIVASSLRFSFGATTTEAEIDEAVQRIANVCRDLRG